MSRSSAALLLILVACGDPPALSGKVTDIWGKPVEGATVRVEGVTAHGQTDAGGLFRIEAEPGKRRVEAGRAGYIKAGTVVDLVADADWPQPTLELYPEPAAPGFYAVGPREYSPVGSKEIRTVGTEVRALTGLVDVGAVELSGAKPTRFVFSSTLRHDEISRIGLQLHKLEFIAQQPVPGVLGEAPVDVNLWVAREAVPFDLVSLPDEHDYLITTRAPLAAGHYAFHTERVLLSTDVAALAQMPRELQVAYPFEVR